MAAGVIYTIGGSFRQFGGPATNATVLPFAAFQIQYFGLLAERWFFFAQANHPHNLDYQTV